MSDRISRKITLDVANPLILFYGAKTADSFLLAGNASRICSIDRALYLILRNHGFKYVAYQNLKSGLLFFDEESRSIFAPRIAPRENTASLRFRNTMAGGPLGTASVRSESPAQPGPNEGLSMSDQSVIKLMDHIFSRYEDVAFLVDWSWIKYLSSDQVILRDFEGCLQGWTRTTSTRKKIIFISQEENLEGLKGGTEHRSPLAPIMGFLDQDGYSNIVYVTGPEEDEITGLVNHFRFTPATGVEVVYKKIHLLPRLLASSTQVMLKDWFNHCMATRQIGFDVTRKSVKTNPALAVALRDSISGKPARERLDELIGLRGVKERIGTLENMLREKIGDSTTLHMAFLGNPGTGKTTVAELIGEIFRDIGVLRRGHTVLAKADDLVGEYIGSTKPKTNRLIDSALDGILFIDEAHQLAEGGEHNYGKEAIGALVARMDKERERLCVIFAGYTEPIKAMINTDPGLVSRTKTLVQFDDYTPDELYDVFLLMAKGSSIPFSEDALADIREVIEMLTTTKNPVTWANAREMRNLLETILGAYANNKRRNVEHPKTVLPEDIPETYRARMKSDVDFEEILKEFDGLVGLKPVKEQIEKIVHAINRNRKKKIASSRGYHMIFSGNPGTGKTTVARIMARVFMRMGIVSSDQPLELNAADIAGRYVGDGQEKTKELLNNNMGRVIFLDEAYGLTQGSMSGSYGTDVINNVLVPYMENYREKMVFILAGYTAEMEEFLNANSGLRSRTSYTVEFPDFTAPEMLEIFIEFARQARIVVPDKLREGLLEAFQIVAARKPRHFGNAREVRKWLEEAESNLAKRLQGAQIEEGEDILIEDDLPEMLRNVRRRPAATGKSVTGSDDFEKISLYRTPDTEIDEAQRIELINTRAKRAMVFIDVKTSDGKGTGSGFNIRGDGKILTAAHVIEGATSIEVRFTENDRLRDKRYQVTVLHADPAADIALLQIQGGDIFEFLELMSPAYTAPIGTPVGLMGYPKGETLGLNVSFTQGAVSSYRDTDGFRAIQIDATAHSGSSGGALLDLRYGKVIGILHGGYKKAAGLNIAVDTKEVYSRLVKTADED